MKTFKEFILNENYNEIVKIMDKLKEVFAPLDKKVETDTIRWAHERMEAVKEFQQSPEYGALKSNAAALYEKIFSLAGGKSWYNLLWGRSRSDREDKVKKYVAGVAEKRNASIAKKLQKLGIKNVISEKFTNTKDGFNGIFVVETDKGNKSIVIETILAGGYNIQALHMRVLVKVK